MFGQRVAVPFVIFCLVAGAAVAQELVGPARVIDGDTLEVAGQRIRIHGIDAPETKQLCDQGMDASKCGELATRALTRLIRGEPVRCEQRDVDRFERIVAVCFNVGGNDIGKAMVRQGWAMAYRQFSMDYVVDEERAKAAKSGIWTTVFIPPWEWRREQRR